jgi:hypothetical protein
VDEAIPVLRITFYGIPDDGGVRDATAQAQVNPDLEIHPGGYANLVAAAMEAAAKSLRLGRGVVVPTFVGVVQ